MGSESRRTRRVDFLVNTTYWAVIVAIVYFVFKYLLRLLMPFFLALVFAALVRPISHYLSRETRYVKNEKGEKVLVRRRVRMNRTLAGILSVVVLFLVAGGILVLVVIRVSDTAAALISSVPVFYETSVAPGFERIYTRMLELAERMDPSVKDALAGAVPNLITNLGSTVTNLSARAVSWLTSIATRLPRILLSTMICLIATVFIAVDFDRIKNFIRRNLSEKTLRIAVNVRTSFLEMVWQFLKSYFIIFCITTVEISLGLFIIGVEKPVLIALIIAVLDAFPIVGSGLVLLPWAGAMLITGSYVRGLGLLAVYTFVAVFRQIIEPRIVGKHVGLRPLVTLICMYVGTKLFGGMGLFALPIMAAILADLNSNGVIQLFRSAGTETGEDKLEEEA
jgi:sporulation integral membrane protein YtvI